MPAFDRITESHFLPAFDFAIERQRAEVEAIAANPDPPTFQNTMESLERSGLLLERVHTVFLTLCSAHTNPRLQQIEAQVAPLLAAHRDSIFLDRRLFVRVDDLHRRLSDLNLDPESEWLLKRYHTDFVRAGIGLSGPDADRLRTLNAELAVRYATFSRRLLEEANELSVLVTDRDQLDGLPEDGVNAAAEAARSGGHEGAYLIALTLPTAQPALTYLHDRALRERIHRASTERGARGNDNDTTDLVREIVRLRAERAWLLGYDSHADYQIEDCTARTVANARGMLESVVPAAVANARAEETALQAVVDADGGGFRLEAWDWSYYAERVRRDRYAVDEGELRPYLELERVLSDGVFYAAERLYGLTFQERHDVPVYHPDVRVFEVFDADRTPLGLFLADFYARPSKRGGAWMTSLVAQSRLLGTRPVVINTHNISQPPPGEPTLLTLFELKTVFHEFGHALHGLFSDVRFPRFAGTQVPQDFVEYPSQVNEMWMFWPEVLANYARHYRTGEPMPREMVDRLHAAARFNEGYRTTEYLSASLLDLAWHTLGADDRIADVRAFEAEVLEKAGFSLRTVPPRYRTTYFEHIFSGDHYSAGYYSYIWSEVLDADTVRWFEENGGLERANGDRFRQEVLSRGGTADAMSFFRSLRGRDPEILPLLERRGLRATTG
ncbi:M3 family metallopeptidase [Micromonospora tarensis]|uniref:M3 family metallopeptidase n=1 Tax=Micromonospora tarensis TaxID=2806100 RepID=UPI002816003D|nr:M3 family metallopeptidase [Micromonospora tarensis]